jgi:hypothetical protein
MMTMMLKEKTKEGVHVLAWWTPLLHFFIYWVEWKCPLNIHN